MKDHKIQNYIVFYIDNRGRLHADDVRFCVIHNSMLQRFIQHEVDIKQSISSVQRKNSSQSSKYYTRECFRQLYFLS